MVITAYDIPVYREIIVPHKEQVFGTFKGGVITYYAIITSPLIDVDAFIRQPIHSAIKINLYEKYK